MKVKQQAESKGPWDYFTVSAKIPAEDAFRPLGTTGCAMTAAPRRGSTVGAEHGFSQTPQTIRGGVVARPRAHVFPALARGPRQLRDIAVFAIDSAATLQLRACRAPNRGRRAGLWTLEPGLDHRWNRSIRRLPAHSNHFLVAEVALQRRENASRMNRESANAVRLPAPVQSEREQRVRRLRLTVGLPFVVGAMVEVDVVPDDVAARVCNRGQGDDARASAVLQWLFQAARQLEMSQMTDCELRLPSVAHPRQWRGHDSGIVDQAMQWLSSLAEFAREFSNAGEVREVHLGNLDRALEALH